MSRKHKLKNKLNTPAPASRSQTHPKSASELLGRPGFLTGEAENIEERFIRVMIDSAELADEPEFADLYMDGEKAAQVTARWLEKYMPILSAAKNKTQDEIHQANDEMRIEVIKELATPSFRKDLLQRLQILIDRLSRTKDQKKLEVAFLLHPILSRQIELWGVCGLILGIYNRSMERYFGEREEENELIGAIASALKEEGKGPADIEALLEAPDSKLKQVAEKVFGANPNLREKAEKQIDDMVVAFEQDLQAGNVKLELFTLQELNLFAERVLGEFGETLDKTKQTEEINKRVFEILLETIRDLMTPQRFQQLRKDVKSIADTWVRERRKWGAALEAELFWLGEDKYEENSFVPMVFLKQLASHGKQQEREAKRKKRGRWR